MNETLHDEDIHDILVELKVSVVLYGENYFCSIASAILVFRIEGDLQAEMEYNVHDNVFSNNLAISTSPLHLQMYVSMVVQKGQT